MRSRKLILVSFAVCSLLLLSSMICGAQAVEKAQAVLKDGTHEKSAERRVAAVRVLGLITEDPQAIQMAENALNDRSPLVRSAAATALGQMHASGADAELRQALNDKDLHVVLAAAHALRQLNDNSCYEVYYALLTGERKNNSGLIKQETQILHDPKQVAEMGFNEGIGYVPFASTGWEAVETIMKDRKDGAAAKAALISALATDPDAHTNELLVTASQNTNWVIQVAALEAIAKRQNPALSPKIEKLLNDSKNEVKYTAAAAIMRLNDVAKVRQATAHDRSAQPGNQAEQRTACVIAALAANKPAQGDTECSVLSAN